MVFHLDLAQRLVTDKKSDFRVNCCGAARSLPKLRRLCDLKAEAIDGCGFRRFVTRSQHWPAGPTPTSASRGCRGRGPGGRCGTAGCWSGRQEAGPVRSSEFRPDVIVLPQRSLDLRRDVAGRVDFCFFGADDSPAAFRLHPARRGHGVGESAAHAIAVGAWKTRFPAVSGPNLSGSKRMSWRESLVIAGSLHDRTCPDVITGSRFQ